MICYLIRHGQQIPHPGDPGLTDIGKQQAQQVGKFLIDKSIDTIISSPLKRTIETAQEISSVIGVDYIDQRLAERMNWSSDSISPEKFVSEWNKSTLDRDYTPLYGDSSIDTGNRISNVIASQMHELNIVLVTHGGAIGDYLRNTFSEDETKPLYTKTRWGNDYLISHCSITQIEINDKPHLRLLNSTHHLSIVTA